jgi:hypothetical protein
MQFEGLKALRSWARGALNAGENKTRRFAARVAGRPDAPIANGLLIFYMVFVLFLLALAVGALYDWRTGSGKGNVFVAVLSHIASDVFDLLAITWLVLLIIWISRWFSDRRAESRD